MKYMCTVCGYIHEGDTAPEYCPQCKAPQSKFKEMNRQSMALADEHRIGIAQGLDPDIVESLRVEFTVECSEVGMYLAMSRQADREGYPEIAESYKRIAFEEAEHAAKYAEILGDLLVADTKQNLQKRVESEYGSCDDKKKLANKTKQQNLDAIHDAVHEMCRDEARHHNIFCGLLKRHFS